MRMKRLGLAGFWFLGLAAASALRAQDFFDQLDAALTRSAFHENLRFRFSGLIDFEAYHFDQPAPGLINSNGHNLFNPRFTLFLDAQLGPHLYAFAESRLDRGFDPGDRGARLRLDEYAIRITPWDEGSFNLQIGKFATIVGNWVERHLSWENPLITAPLPYENVTPISDTEPPASARAFLKAPAVEKYNRNPIIWGPSYTSGLALIGRLGKFDYAAEVKNAALASRPQSWSATDTGFDHPAIDARIGVRPNQAWRIGFSASDGSYLRPEAAAMLPANRRLGDYRELVLGQDVSFAWHHVQLWAEFYEARFEVPRIGNADTFAYYFEGKYEFTPQLFGALRWNQQLFATVRDGEGGHAPWGHDTWRIDAGLGYRFTAHSQLKLQYSLQRGNVSSSALTQLLAAQFTVRF
ncbi:MAG: hypothetical protein JO069_21770 [Verrucomicrobia bacterium]|nr:hypothetical protein [Verrucomicrobiota bacterium]